MKLTKNNLFNNYPEIKILMNEPLSNYTYTKTGGPADYLAFPKNSREVQQLLKVVDEQKLPLTVLGNASNLIVKDGGIRGLVIILTDMKNITVHENEIVAQAGAGIIETSEVAYEASLTGLEFAAGIPGSIGGAIFMNAGAYGGEMSEVVKEVKVLTLAGELKTYSNAEMNFSYRHSRVQETQDIVLEATYYLTPGEATAIRAKMDELNCLRAEKQPLEYPSCGSVFKRPEGYYTGKLIHDAGLQGFQIGGAQVSLKHAGFIVNVDQATATDYMQVISHVKAVILEKFAVQLETEVRIIGED